MVTITTADGKVYTDPKLITVPRTPKTERFYRMLEDYEPPVEKSNSREEEVG